VEISSDGNYIVGGGYIDETSGRVAGVYFFESNSSTPLFTYETEYSANSVAISADGSYFVASDVDNIYFFNRNASTPLWIYPHGSGHWVNVAITSDGNYVVAGCETGSSDYQGDYLMYFSKEEANPIWGSRLGGTIYHMSMSSDGTHIATISGDGYVYSFQDSKFAYKHKLVNLTPGVMNPIISSNVAMSSDGKYFAVTSNRTISLFDKTFNSPVYEYETRGLAEGSGTGRPGVAIASSSAGIYVVGNDFLTRSHEHDILLLGPAQETFPPIWLVILALLAVATGALGLVIYVFKKRSPRPRTPRDHQVDAAKT